MRARNQKYILPRHVLYSCGVAVVLFFMYIYSLVLFFIFSVAHAPVLSALMMHSLNGFERNDPLVNFSLSLMAVEYVRAASHLLSAQKR